MKRFYHLFCGVLSLFSTINAQDSLLKVESWQQIRRPILRNLMNRDSNPVGYHRAHEAKKLAREEGHSDGEAMFALVLGHLFNYSPEFGNNYDSTMYYREKAVELPLKTSNN